MEAHPLRPRTAAEPSAWPSPLLQLYGDEQLVELASGGARGPFEALVVRYRPGILAFCRHMLGSIDDAEDAVQDVFASAYESLRGASPPTNFRPWLYRIARNRCLKQLRRPREARHESMDGFERATASTAADTAHDREEFRQIIFDVQNLAESQRTALLLREIEALSYGEIADSMETTVSSVKSLLVRARMSLAEAAESRQVTCPDVRLELSSNSEVGDPKKISRSTRRHLRSCERCRVFDRELKRTERQLAAVYPVAPILAAQGLSKAGSGVGGSRGGEEAAAGSIAGGSAAVGGSAAGGSAIAGGSGVFGGAAGIFSAGAGAIAVKATAGLAAAALITVGAVKAPELGWDGAPRKAVAAPEIHAPRGATELAQAVKHPAAATDDREAPARFAAVEVPGPRTQEPSSTGSDGPAGQPAADRPAAPVTDAPVVVQPAPLPPDQAGGGHAAPGGGAVSTPPVGGGPVEHPSRPYPDLPGPVCCGEDGTGLTEEGMYPNSPPQYGGEYQPDAAPLQEEGTTPDSPPQYGGDAG